jgi:hypothetical protein
VRLPSPYEEGLLVVQDGSNTRPRAPQNFKLVPWSEVRARWNSSREPRGTVGKYRCEAFVTDSRNTTVTAG